MLDQSGCVSFPSTAIGASSPIQTQLPSLSQRDQTEGRSNMLMIQNIQCLQNGE